MDSRDQIWRLLQDATKTYDYGMFQKMRSGYIPRFVVSQLVENGWAEEQAAEAVDDAIRANLDAFIASWNKFVSFTNQKQSIEAIIEALIAMGLDPRLAVAVAHSAHQTTRGLGCIFTGAAILLILIYIMMASALTAEGKLILALVLIIPFIIALVRGIGAFSFRSQFDAMFTKHYEMYKHRREP